MGANHAANAMRLITIKRPSLKSLSGIGAAIAFGFRL
jgi:hypothetical protein